MTLLTIASTASGLLLVILGFLALLVINLLLGLIEGVILTFLRWNPTRTCLQVSFIMNMISGLINGLLLIFLQRSPMVWLPVSFVISLAVEWFIMSYFKRETILQNSFYAIIANLGSYVLLILPAFYFGSHP